MPKRHLVFRRAFSIVDGGRLKLDQNEMVMKHNKEQDLSQDGCLNNYAKPSSIKKGA